MKNIILSTFTTIILNIQVPAQPAELLSAKAKVEFEKQNFALCIEEMSKLIIREPKNDAALVERARCLYLSADDTNDEKIILSEISKTMSDKDKANSAVMVEVTSRRKKAIADATTAIAINPRNAAAYNIRGLVKSSLGTKDRRESIADFDKAIEIDPTFIKPYFNRGTTKADMSDYGGAVADFTKVIELDPTNIAARDNLSRYKIYSTLTVTSGCVSGNCVNGKGKFNLEGGDVYEGDFVNSVKQGQGTYTFKNGVVYIGQFAKDEFNGIGKIKYTNGEIYEGDFVNSKRHGKGKNIYFNGDVYEGDYVNGNREGQGIYTYKNEDAYAGEWKNNYQNGDGKFYSKSTNEVQDGIWKDGVLLNAATEIAPLPSNSDASSKGNKSNLSNSKEADVDANVAARKAEVELKRKIFPINKTNSEKLKAAQEILQKQNELIQYLSDAINGADLSQNAKSKYKESIEKEKKLILQIENLIKVTGDAAKYDPIQPSPPVTTGCVSGNCVKGKGKYIYANGNIYEGDFINSKREGKGVLTIKGVEVYEGELKNDQRNGKGISMYINGDKYEGNFLNSVRGGPGTYTYKDGSFYTGDFKDNMPNGYGKEFNKVTNSFREGTWKDGILISKANQSITNPMEASSNALAKETAILLQETLNGKFEYMEAKPLLYILTMRKSEETFRYQIEFIKDGEKLAFRWKESTKKEQSEQLFITLNAIVSANKFVHFFNTKSAILPDKEIAFILSQTLYKDLKDKKEIKIDLGSGTQLMSFKYSLTAPIGTYTIKNIKKLLFKSDDGKNKMQILDDPICPLILEIETPEYTLTLVKN